MYRTCEQSRKPRVKCRQDGELCDGRRTCSAMGLPHPLLHNGLSPLCSNDTRSGERSAVYLTFPAVSIILYFLPDFSRGFSVLWVSGKLVQMASSFALVLCIPSVPSGMPMLRFTTSNTTKALPSEGELFKLQRRPLCPRDGVTKRGREREQYIFRIQ